MTEILDELRLWGSVLLYCALNKGNAFDNLAYQSHDIIFHVFITNIWSDFLIWLRLPSAPTGIVLREYFKVLSSVSLTQALYKHAYTNICPDWKSAWFKRCKNCFILFYFLIGNFTFRANIFCWELQFIFSREKKNRIYIAIIYSIAKSRDLAWVSSPLGYLSIITQRKWYSQNTNGEDRRRKNLGSLTYESVKFWPHTVFYIRQPASLYNKKNLNGVKASVTEILRLWTRPSRQYFRRSR